MFEAKIAAEMAKKFVDSLPPAITAFRGEIEQQLRHFLQQGLNKMNLVTREEFDIQTKVLERTRLKLEEMSVQLESLNKKLFTDPPVSQ